MRMLFIESKKDGQSVEILLEKLKIIGDSEVKGIL